jgi:hypothetical protein
MPHRRHLLRRMALLLTDSPLDYNAFTWVSLRRTSHQSQAVNDSYEPWQKRGVLVAELAEEFSKATVSDTSHRRLSPAPRYRHTVMLMYLRQESSGTKINMRRMLTRIDTKDSKQVITFVTSRLCYRAASINHQTIRLSPSHLASCLLVDLPGCTT